MRLLSLSIDEILQLVNEMEKEVGAYKEEMYRCCWFMRGGVTIEQLFNADAGDLQIIQKIITSNLETAKESGMPFF